ncbi:hypothetical protein [Actinoallomurus acanthiterrae]
MRLCRETVWQDGPEETLVQALGQRVLVHRSRRYQPAGFVHLYL